ncbi:MAG TPA: hypothetical protein VMB79_02640 [Jatrophihabitans sp.]|nr:hypothetical protein [Jatrophihabitans sp.]
MSELLVAANAAGLSARSIARQAQEQGFTINHDTAARYLRGDHGRPDEDTLRAFASVLPVRLADLRAAAQLPAEETEPYRPPAEASRLSRRQRRAIDEIIRAMLEAPSSTPVNDLSAERAAGRRRGTTRTAADAAPRAASPRAATPRAARRGGAEPPVK